MQQEADKLPARRPLHSVLRFRAGLVEGQMEHALAVPGHLTRPDVQAGSDALPQCGSLIRLIRCHRVRVGATVQCPLRGRNVDAADRADQVLRRPDRAEVGAHAQPRGKRHNACHAHPHRPLSQSDNRDCQGSPSVVRFAQITHKDGPMNVSLTPELEKLIADKVATGMYPSANEVVREALRLLERRDNDPQARLDDLRRDIEEGFAQIERGEYYEFTTPEDLVRSVTQAIHDEREK